MVKRQLKKRKLFPLLPQNRHYSCSKFIFVREEIFLLPSRFSIFYSADKMLPLLAEGQASKSFKYSRIIGPKKCNAFLKKLFIFIFFFSFPMLAKALIIPFRYHNYVRLTRVLQQLNADYPNLTRLYSIGQSENGRQIWVLVISTHPNERPMLMPAVKYVGNMHGNEAVGREALLHYANDLLTNFGSNTEITQLVNSTQIHILPSMNPDGFEIAREGQCTGVLGRYNADLIDLNRNFPDSKRSNPGRRAAETKKHNELVGDGTFRCLGEPPRRRFSRVVSVRQLQRSFLESALLSIAG